MYLVLSTGSQCVWRQWRRGRPWRLGGAVRRRLLGAGWRRAFQTCGHQRLSECDRRAVWTPHQGSTWSARHEICQPTQLVALHGGRLHPAEPGTNTPRWALIFVLRAKSIWRPVWMLTWTKGVNDVGYFIDSTLDMKHSGCFGVWYL